MLNLLTQVTQLKSSHHKQYAILGCYLLQKLFCRYPSNTHQ